MNSFEERKHEIEQLTQFVAELSLKFTAYSPDFVSSIPDRQKKHMVSKHGYKQQAVHYCQVFDI